MVLRGQERHRRHGHHVRDRRQLLGRGLRRGDEPGDRLRRGRQEEHATHDRPDLVQTEPEPGRDAEVATPAADRPEQIRLGLRVHAVHRAVGGHDVGGQQVVDREAVLAHEEADAAAADPDPAQAVRATGSMSRAFMLDRSSAMPPSETL